ncbi:TIGR03915 family putative DNA repair protein [Mesonia ostreae]|uniref:TIGR03915 family putative DNA repair protein n=1 Tax=Mesonia ostreae TaxID=861110 RepID=A0ABU2KL33_9FLAO|nr:TIGR03915 family putative DNA repair protein [Mesonia ostreae]MDT0295359.1 TIGR03915 family putative DNA repair protein [Mesonia ostreae]
MQTVFIYDGSFEGLLTAIFEVYELKSDTVHIVTNAHYTASFFEEKHEVATNTQKAKRLWKGILKNAKPTDANLIYRCFLSELPDMEQSILKYVQLIFLHKQSVAKDFGEAYVFRLAEINKKIGREKHRMEAFVRFRKTKDGIYFSSIAPDFNVLPLIESHFKKRYADQIWCIYDISRNYGLYYDLKKVEMVHLELPPSILSSSTSIFEEEELNYQKLWKNYFESTNITARANQKLHEQHVPRRYWKYLSEKNLLEW